MAVSKKTPQTILVIEDDENVSQVLEYFLARAGFNAIVATDGRQGRILIDNMPAPFAVLSDVMLPYFDGFQLIEHIRAKPDWQGTRVVMISGKTDERDIIRALSAGANDYITKPFQPQELVARMKRYQDIEATPALLSQREQLVSKLRQVIGTANAS